MYLLPLDLVSKKSTFNQSELAQRMRKFAEWPLDMYHSVGYVSPCIVCGDTNMDLDPDQMPHNVTYDQGGLHCLYQIRNPWLNKMNEKLISWFTRYQSADLSLKSWFFLLYFRFLPRQAQRDTEEECVSILFENIPGSFKFIQTWADPHRGAAFHV